MAFELSIDGGIAELVVNNPPVNAFATRHWFELAHRFVSCSAR